MATDLNIYEGEDKTWSVTIKDSDGVVMDITGYTFLFVIKNNRDDTDANAVIKKEITSHSDPTNGITQITIDSADTSGKSGEYLYDYQWKDASSKRKAILKKATFLVERRIGDDFS